MLKFGLIVGYPEGEQQNKKQKQRPYVDNNPTATFVCLGMCRWVGSHFHGWIDYNGVAFSMELLEWGRIFSRFGCENILASRDFGY